VSTPFLLGLACVVGGLAMWYFKRKAANDALHEAASRKARTAAQRSTQSVAAAIRGRR
jgi:hypothetical protein